MTLPNGPSPTEGGFQIHRSKAEWDAIAVTLEFKNIADLLKHRYQVLRQSSPEIAKWLSELGYPVTPLRVRQLMRKCKLKRRPVAAPRYPAAFWRGVDWSKSNQQIADEKNVDPMTVKRWRERLETTKKQPSGDKR